MKSILIKFLTIVIVVYYSTATYAANKKYITEPSELPPSYEKTFHRLKGLIDTGNIQKQPLIKRELDDFIKKQPNFLPIYVQKVRFITSFNFHPFVDRKKAWKDSEILLLKTRKKDPKYFKVYSLLTSVYINQNNYSEAKKSNAIAIKLNSNNPWGKLDFVKINSYYGNVEKSKKILTDLLINNYKDKRLTYFIIQTMKFAADKSAPSLIKEVFSSFLTQAEFTKDELVRVIQETVSEYRNNNQYLIESYVLLKYLIKIDKDYIPTQFVLIDFYRRLGYQYSDGLIPQYSNKVMATIETTLLTIKRKNNKNKKVYFYLAEHYFSKKDFKAMSEILNESIKLGYNREPYLELMGAHFLTYQGMFDKSIPIYNRIIKMKGKYLKQAESGLLMAYKNTSNIKGVEKIYLSKIKREPAHAFGYGNYAIFLMNFKGDYEKAIIYGSKALKISNYGIARTTLAAAYYAKWATQPKKTPEANSYYNKAETLQPLIGKIKQYCGKYCDQIYAKYNKRIEKSLKYK